MSNRRTTERLPSFLGGTIIYNRNRWSTPCLVKNLSRTGARLTAKNLPSLPDSFELHVPQKKATYAVRVKWREGDVVGVEIDGVVPASDGDAKHRAGAKAQGSGRRQTDMADLGI
jgi:hypothetical protein